ncbi:hypothetical protein J2Y73_004921 [Peribacillus frigoritolerans]|jgi:hypothetical protein|uniref:Uncharacterized protein n=1 Tax=Peribacillus simplex TaxID=1478 RepID=A0AAN2TTA0_9BACI|nr:hypothetical protein [Peribacillus frigoritolerans]MDP9740930.1 hypothetical protein [Bacillus sp. B2I3]CAH0136273.1 hypothetical protein SRABI134_00415 [Peribacillus sp. Bi134]CEG32798.1 hypothetical protein BN1180_02965 [Peribacillus simplex]CRH73165.1 Uncharacterised protein [Chlamydia trachomatis]
MYDEILVNSIKAIFVIGTISMFVILGFVKGRRF